jgi:purine-nucleoside phosphorylase
LKPKSETRNPKPEIRNSKFETNPKDRKRKTKTNTEPVLVIWIWVFEFVSYFVFRISYFPHTQPARPRVFSLASMPDFVPFAALTEEARRRPPQAALVLGSGLAALADRLDSPINVHFVEVPGLGDHASVAGHKGCLSLGDWGGKRVLLFQGRLHFYEGQPWQKVVVPVTIARDMGAKVLLLTNAAGGIRDDLGPGSLMAVTDHIQWTWAYCWRRSGPGGMGAIRPSPYSARLVDVLLRAAGELSLPLRTGVYAQVTGPCYETPAEIRALRTLGADAVGMSTAREIEAAHELGMECAALSCITNRAAGLCAGPLHHDEVLTTAAAETERVGDLIERFLAAA